MSITAEFLGCAMDETALHPIMQESYCSNPETGQYAFYDVSEDPDVKEFLPVARATVEEYPNYYPDAYKYMFGG